MPDRADKTVTIPGELRGAVAKWLQCLVDGRRREAIDDIARLRALAEEIGGDE